MVKTLDGWCVEGYEDGEDILGLCFKKFHLFGTIPSTSESQVSIVKLLDILTDYDYIV